MDEQNLNTKRKREEGEANEDDSISKKMKQEDSQANTQKENSSNNATVTNFDVDLMFPTYDIKFYPQYENYSPFQSYPGYPGTLWEELVENLS